MIEININTKRIRLITKALLILLCFSSMAMQAQNEGDLSSGQKEYLLQFVHPLNTYEPDSNDTADLKILNKFIGASKVVALGEVTHGSSEIFKMKDRIVRHLSQNSQFDIFAIEAAMPESYLMNHYSINGKNDAKRYLKGMYFWTWNVSEIYDMVNWMKKYNDGHPKKITFTGFDMQHFQGALNELKQLNTQKGWSNEDLEKLQTLLIGIREKTTEKKSRTTLIDSIQKARLTSLLESIKTNFEKFTDPDKKWGKQNIRLIEQYLDKSGFNRDKYMAENVLWIKNNHPDSKLIVWAHNAHIKKTGMSMGKQLSEKLKQDYTSIGFTFYRGSYTAMGQDFKLGIHESQQGYEGTLEYFLNSLEIPIFILDLKALKQDNDPLGEWILKKIPYRRIGALSRADKDNFLKANVSDDFDYLVFIKESTNSKLLER